MAKDFTLLTGSTGFVGSNLLNALELQNTQVLSLVRRTSNPIIGSRFVYGDTTKEYCGLSREALKFVKNYCGRIIHCAADVNFSTKSDINLASTKNIIDLCQFAGIDNLHYVSTAYVCGNRQDVIYENELDKQQDFKNEYERSKFLCELEVQKSGLLSTIYRPAIVVGNSQTGECSSFRTFYTLIKFAQQAKTLKDKFGMGDNLLRLNLTKYELVNIVPIDWVINVMMVVLNKPESHGKTYHIVPTNSIILYDIVEAFSQYFDFNNIKFVGQRQYKPITELVSDLSPLEEYFYSALSTYLDYWGKEPKFDTRNVNEIMAGQSCHVDIDCIKRIIDYAVRNDFKKVAA